MSIVITAAKLADVNLGITDITWNGLPMPLPDRDSPIQVQFVEDRVMFGAAGNISNLGGFTTKHDIEAINVPTIQSGADFWAFMDPIGGSTSGGGSAPARMVGQPLVITTNNGVLTVYKAQPIREATIEYNDQAITVPSILFACYADITRVAGSQVWSFA